MPCSVNTCSSCQSLSVDSCVLLITICNGFYWIRSENWCGWGMAVFCFLHSSQVNSLMCRCLNASVGTREKRTEHKATWVDTEPEDGLDRPALAVGCAQHKVRIYQYDVELVLRSIDLSLYCEETYPLNLLSGFLLSYSGNFRCLCYGPNHVSLLSFPLPFQFVMYVFMCYHHTEN